MLATGFPMEHTAVMNSEGCVETTLARANRLFREGRYEEALQAYEAAMAERPALASIVRSNLVLIEKRIFRGHGSGVSGLNLKKNVDIHSFFMHLSPEALRDDSYKFIRLMHYIWNSRPDLQKTFDIFTNHGRLEFFKWFFTNANHEYGLTPEVYPADVLDIFVSAGGEIAEQALRMLNEQKKYHNTSRIETTDTPIPSKPFGANLFGSAFGEFGMGQHVRSVASSLNASGIPFCVINHDVRVHGSGDLTLSQWITHDPIYDINIYKANSDVFPLLYFKYGKRFFSGYYNIGYWAWELPNCPTDFDLALNMFDEIWAISDFVAESLKTRSPAPVFTMPLAVTVPDLDPSVYTKSYYGLPEDKFVFYFIFDAASYLDRKNPLDVLRAFRLAFPKGDEKVHLLLKTMNSELGGHYWDVLMEEVGDDPRISLMNKRLARNEVLGLNLACDAFVSLHRSEGFGFSVAEAMAYGKPVVVTNYSGTKDFANEGTACVVDYRLVPVPEGSYPFWKDQVWAEPDIEQAAFLLRKLFIDKEFREKIAFSGQRCVLENFNEKIIGKRYAERIKKIEIFRGRISRHFEAGGFDPPDPASVPWEARHVLHLLAQGLR
jgi:glycosyltransferase involved in cell wall biosynthesis